MSYVCKLEYQSDLFYDNYRTLSKNTLNQNNLKNTSCEVNKTINLSQCLSK